MLVEVRPWGQRERGWRSQSGKRSRPCGKGWDEHLRSGWPVAQRGMRPDRIEVPSPALDDDLSLPQGVEYLPIQQLVPEARIETLDEPILPRRAARDVGRLGSDRRNPLLHGLGHELRPIIGTDVARNTS